MKIGVMFGNPETTTGGNALKFYSSVRLEVRKIETIQRTGEDAIGNRVRIKVVKTKVAPPFRRAALEIMFGSGLSASGSLLEAATQQNIVEKSGTWYSYDGERIGQGRENAKAFLEAQPLMAEAIEKKVRELLFPDGKARSATNEAAQSDDNGTKEV